MLLRTLPLAPLTSGATSVAAKWDACGCVGSRDLQAQTNQLQIALGAGNNRGGYLPAREQPGEAFASQGVRSVAFDRWQAIHGSDSATPWILSWQGASRGGAPTKARVLRDATLLEQWRDSLERRLRDAAEKQRCTPETFAVTRRPLSQNHAFNLASKAPFSRNLALRKHLLSEDTPQKRRFHRGAAI